MNSKKQKFSVGALTTLLVLFPAFALADTSYATPGTYTFTVPTYGSLTVTVTGAGAGGGGGLDRCGASTFYTGATGGTGGNSSFNSSVVGNGGVGGTGGSYSGGTINGSTGSNGTASGGDTNTTGGGAGGGGGGSFSAGVTGGTGGAGGSGGLSVKTYSSGALTVGSGITVVVGSGGSGGAGGAGCFGAGSGTGGSNGSVVIQWSASFQHTTIKLTGNVKFTSTLNVGGALTKGAGTFAIDDPLDPANTILFHSFVESPDVKNFYDGIVTLDANGEAVIKLPDYWDALNNNPRYQYAPLDQSMPNLYIKQEEQSNQFVIAGGVAGGKVSWQLTGIRHDPYILAHPIIVEVLKGPGQIVDKGQCVFAPLCQ